MILAGTMRLFVGDIDVKVELVALKNELAQLANIEQKILAALIDDITTTEIFVDSTELSQDSFLKLREAGYVTQRTDTQMTWISWKR